MIFALIDVNNIVTQLIIADQSFIDANPGLGTAIQITGGQPNVGDTYLGNGAFGPTYPALPIALANQIAAFQAAVQEFVSSRYSVEVRLNLNAIYQLAVMNGSLPNRVAYIAQIFTWSNSIIAYAASFVATLKSKVSSATVMTTHWDFSSFEASDPQINPMIAIGINN